MDAAMKVNQLRVKVIEGASAATLEAAITAWLQTQGEATFIAIEYQVAGTTSYSVLITYTL